MASDYPGNVDKIKDFINRPVEPIVDLTGLGDYSISPLGFPATNFSGDSNPTKINPMFSATYTDSKFYANVRENTAQSGSVNTITLDTGASATDNYYTAFKIQIVSGTGVGQIKNIINYVGSTKVATVDVNWSVNPDNTSKFLIYVTVSQSSEFGVIRKGLVQASASGTVTLDSFASDVDSFYNGYTIKITDGTGTGQNRTITGYVGSTKIATINSSWSTNPDLSSVFLIITREGIAQAATSTSITLDTGASSTTGFYDSYTGLLRLVKIISGSNVGQIKPTIEVSPGPTYNGSTKVLTIGEAWNTIINPDSTSVFSIISRENTAQTGSSNIITLDSGASAVDSYYNGMTINIVGGTGLGQNRTISGYVGATKVATVSVVWTTNPDSTSIFSIVARQNIAQAGSGTTLTLDSGASASNSFYNGMILRILHGTGVGLVKIITGYVGSTKVATVENNWAYPDSTSNFQILEIHPYIWDGTENDNKEGVYPQPIYTILQNTAQDGGLVNTIVLNSGASGPDGFYNGYTIEITRGLGFGQIKKIIGYVGSTKTATVDSDWNVGATPDHTSVFRILVYQDTAQSGSTHNTIKFSSASSTFDNFYNGLLVTLTGGTAGTGQVRTILSYVGTTKIATVNSDWDSVSNIIVSPNNTTIYTLSNNADHFRRDYSSEEVVNYLRDKLYPTFQMGADKGTLLDWVTGTSPVNIGGGGKVFIDPFGAFQNANIARTVGPVNPKDNTALTNKQAQIARHNRYTTWNITNDFAENLTGDNKSPFLKDYPNSYNSENAQLITGTAQAGSGSTITLNSVSKSLDNYYNGGIITIIGGTGNGETNTILSYVGSTKVATVTASWTSNPDNTSIYQITNIIKEGAHLPVSVDADNYRISLHSNTTSTSADLRPMTPDMLYYMKDNSYHNNITLDLSKTSMYGRHSISIMHQLFNPDSGTNLSIVTELDSIYNSVTSPAANPHILRKTIVAIDDNGDGTTDRNINTYYYKRRLKYTLTALVASPTSPAGTELQYIDGSNQVTFRLSPGNDNLNYILSHSTKTAAQIREDVLENNEMVPGVIQITDQIDQLDVIFVNNTDPTNNLADPDSFYNQNKIRSKKTFVHLPTAGIEDGYMLELDVSLPKQQGTECFTENSLGVLSGYKNFITQPRFYVFSGYRMSAGTNCDFDVGLTEKDNPYLFSPLPEVEYANIETPGYNANIFHQRKMDINDIHGNKFIRQVTFISAGYTSAISSDIGKIVQGGTSTSQARLVNYDNTNKVWIIRLFSTSTLFTANETISVVSGTGAGTGIVVGITEQDKRVLIATVYPTNTNTFGYRLDKSPTFKLLHWSILSNSQFQNSASYLAFNRNKYAIDYIDNSTIFNIGLKSFPMSYVNGFVPSITEPFTQYISSHIRLFFPSTLIPITNTDPVDMTDIKYTSFVYQSSVAFNALISDFYAGRLRFDLHTDMTKLDYASNVGFNNNTETSIPSDYNDPAFFTFINTALPSPGLNFPRWLTKPKDLPQYIINAYGEDPNELDSDPYQGTNSSYVSYLENYVVQNDILASDAGVTYVPGTLYPTGNPTYEYGAGSNNLITNYLINNNVDPLLINRFRRKLWESSFDIPYSTAGHPGFRRKFDYFNFTDNDPNYMDYYRDFYGMMSSSFSRIFSLNSFNPGENSLDTIEKLSLIQSGGDYVHSNNTLIEVLKGNPVSLRYYTLNNSGNSDEVKAAKMVGIHDSYPSLDSDVNNFLKNFITTYSNDFTTRFYNSYRILLSGDTTTINNLDTERTFESNTYSYFTNVIDSSDRAKEIDDDYSFVTTYTVRLATTANITLSGSQTIDTISAIAGNRILVKNQSTASQNGIYLVASGAWTRTSDIISNNISIYVTSGSVNLNTVWNLTTANPIILGSTSLNFSSTTKKAEDFNYDWTFFDTGHGTRTSTAQAGAASTITLDAGASTEDNYYVGNLIKITSGTGNGETNIITSYIGSTKVATVQNAWSIATPDNTSGYTIQTTLMNLITANGQQYQFRKGFYDAKGEKTYIRVKMKFIFSEILGRWVTLDYRQYPTSYLTPTFGNAALSYKEKTILLPNTNGSNISDYVPIESPDSGNEVFTTIDTNRSILNYSTTNLSTTFLNTYLDNISVVIYEKLGNNIDAGRYIKSTINRASLNHLVNTRGEWDISTTYNIDDKLTSQGVVYIVQSGSVTGGSLPKYDAEFYIEKNPKIIHAPLWSANNNYSVGDILTYISGIYSVNTKINSGENNPTINSSYTLIHDYYIRPTILNTSITYNIGSLVTYNSTQLSGTSPLLNTPQTIQLDNNANPTIGFYVNSTIQIISGTGIGQVRTIINNYGTRIAKIDSPWVVIPDNTSQYIIYTNNTYEVINPAYKLQDTVAISGNTSTTVNLNTNALAIGNYYNGFIIQLTSGTGVTQNRQIIAFDADSKIATIDFPWNIIPDNTTTFNILDVAPFRQVVPCAIDWDVNISFKNGTYVFYNNGFYKYTSDVPPDPSFDTFSRNTPDLNPSCIVINETYTDTLNTQEDDYTFIINDNIPISYNLTAYLSTYVNTIDNDSYPYNSNSPNTNNTYVDFLWDQDNTDPLTTPYYKMKPLNINRFCLPFLSKVLPYDKFGNLYNFIENWKTGDTDFSQPLQSPINPPVFDNESFGYPLGFKTSIMTVGVIEGNPVYNASAGTWFSNSANTGIVYRNNVTGAYTLYSNYSSLAGSGTENMAFGIASDTLENAYFASGRVVKYNGSFTAFNHSSSPITAQKIYIDKINDIAYVATNFGLYVSDVNFSTQPNTMTWTTYTVPGFSNSIQDIDKELDIIGTAQAGGVSNITLDSVSSPVNDIYVGKLIKITAGTGVGQTKTITGYNGSTNIATVNTAWGTTPDATSVYSIIGFVWIASIYSINLIYKFNGSVVTSETLPMAGLNTSGTNSIRVSTNGDIFVAGWFNTTFISRKDHLTNTWVSFELSDATIEGNSNIRIDSNGNVFFATSNGLYQYITDGTFQIYNQSNGLSFPFNGYQGKSFVMSLDIDSSNNIWLANYGILYFNRYSAKFSYSDFNLQKLQEPHQDPESTITIPEYAQSGSLNTITLSSLSSVIDNAYYDNIIEIIAGTGIGQTNTVLSYVGSTKIATVSNNWKVIPDSTSIYTLTTLSGINFVVPNNVHGGSIDPNRSLFLFQPHLFKVYWHMRPVVSAYNGTDIPSPTARTGGDISDPCLANMFNFPDLYNGDVYRIPWDSDMSINWLVDYDDEDYTIIDEEGALDTDIIDEDDHPDTGIIDE